MTTGQNRHLSAPRHEQPTAKSKAGAYTNMLAEAERQAGEHLDRLITDYLRLLEGAGQMYARAVERGNHAYLAIEQPARAHYERQLEIADQAYNAIVQPAQIELDRINKDTQRMFNEAIVPIEKGLAEAIQAAQALLQGIQIGQGKSPLG